MKPSILILFGLGVLGYAAMPGVAPQAKPVNFDRDVMPILGSHCFKCHGPDAAQVAGDLRLDLFADVTKPHGDNTPVVPGSPEKSFLIERVSAQDVTRMPPLDSGVKPLAADQIETLSQWIRQGAKYEKHWAYVAPVLPSVPVVSTPAWCSNPVDRFVLAKLDEVGMRPEPEADKDTLALRASEALTGLPPSQAELNVFRADTKPGAYERFVDRLLAKPEYGEHEARYWLDAVRYGDTHGLQLDNERGVFPYRDWVIRAYNEDLPFDKFVLWQLAGDLLDHPTTEQLIATGYIRMNLTSNEGGAIAEEFLARNTFDRVDTTSTALLGLTIQCAKCHDHKYDPFKQRDYYGLYAFFDSTKDEPLDGNITLPPPVVRASTPEQEAELASLSATADRLRDAVNPALAASYFDSHHLPVPASRNWQISPVYTAANFDAAFDSVDPPQPGQTAPVDWKSFKFESGKDYPGIIGKDNSSIYLRGTVALPAARTITFGVSSDDGVKVWLNGKLIHSNKVTRGLQPIDQVKGDFKAGDNELIVKVTNGGEPDGLDIRLVDALAKRIEDTVAAYRKGPSDVMAGKNLRTIYLESGPATPEAVKYRATVRKHDDLMASIPMSLIAQEMAKPRPTFILKRGLYDQKGDPVTRHIPPALGELPPGARADRLGFAQWLTSRSNPLLARVFVNRVWQQHFGTGIVKTVEDFGSQGEWPLDQPLLDYLAVSFEQSGWSVKKLNRLIVTSAAFRQSSRIIAAKLSKDPENRLISRGPRFRLDAEAIRDKALFAGGILVEELGGHGVKPYQPTGIWETASDPASSTHFYKQDKGVEVYRRSVYMFWKRTAPPPSLVTFDAPLRDTCIVRRASTDTPLQALTTENETAFLEASRTMAARVLSVPGDDAKRLRLAYDLALARPPRLAEVALLKSALASYRKTYKADPSAAKKLLLVGDTPKAKNLDPVEQASWMMICSTLMNTSEFFTLH